MKGNHQSEIKLETNNLGSQSKTSEVSPANRVPDMEARLSGVEGKVEDRVLQSENMLNLKNPDIRHSEIWDIMKRPNLLKTGIEEGEETQI